MALPKAKRLTIEHYRRLPEGAPYELMEGELVMVPAPSPRHQLVLLRLARILDLYVEEHDLGTVLTAPVDLYLDEENAVQPDLLFIRKERSAILKEDGIYGAPDLVGEILSHATASRDLKEKFSLYERSGIKEYWILDPKTRTFRLYSLKRKRYHREKELKGRGMIHSSLFPGLRIPLERLFPGERSP